MDRPMHPVNRMSTRVISVLAVIAAVLGCSRLLIAEGPRKPNIIFVLADDLGYGDLGCYGQESIRTPNLDHLARIGMRFTNHYSGSTVCAPSRCCLMTGLHTGHVSVRGNTNVLMSPNNDTVAELLKSAGYATACIGKWGIGHPPPPGDPAKHGFDDFYGYLDMYHAHNSFPDFLWKNSARDSVKGNVVKTVGRGGVALKRSKYSHDLFTEKAKSYITQNKDRPFFLFVSFTIPHANNEAEPGEGMEVPDDKPYSAFDWKQPQKNHAAMITRLDASVGQIHDLLKELKIDTDTLFIFSSDNGPHAEGGADPKFFKSSGELRGIKRDLYEGGIRVPLIAVWPDRIKRGATTPHVSAFWDFLPTAAEVAGVKPPPSLDGISYLPTLLGQDDKQKQHEFLYWEFHEKGVQQAVRMGDWKFVRVVGAGPQLFNLKEDRSEKSDVAAEHTDVISKIEEYLKKARTDSKLFPLTKVPSPEKRTQSGSE